MLRFRLRESSGMCVQVRYRRTVKRKAPVIIESRACLPDNDFIGVHKRDFGVIKINAVVYIPNVRIYEYPSKNVHI